MKITKYKVVDQRIRFINDVDAIYQASDDVYKGVIQKLSATYGDYLEEERAITDQWQNSLKNGLLKKYLNEGMIIAVEVEESTSVSKQEELNANPYKQKTLTRDDPYKDPPSRDTVTAISSSDKIASISAVDTTVDWNKLSIEDKRKLMAIEEQKENERIEAEKTKATVIDWSKLSHEDRMKLIKQELDNTRIAESSSKLPVKKASIQIKAQKPRKAKKGDVVKIEDTKLPSVKFATVISGPNAQDPTTITGSPITTLKQFEAMKYQDKLVFISQCTDVALLNDITINAKQDMVKVRAMKRASIVRGGNAT